jgi:hypothetical protein
MSKNVAKRAAAEIARQIIEAARNSGPDPVVWITGNAMMPPRQRAVRGRPGPVRVRRGPGRGDATGRLAARRRLIFRTSGTEDPCF